MSSKETNSESSQLLIKTEPPIPTVAASSSSSAAPPLPLSPPWIDLPEDLTANILQRLDVEDILESVQKLCATWWRVWKNPAMWRVISLDNHICAAHKFENIFRCAVDRSQGQLVELMLSGFQVEGLLNYATDRSSQLRCLFVEDCDTVEIDLTDVIKKLPQLEELHLIMDPMLSPKDFETISISCPMLISFTYFNNWRGYPEFTEHAVAIGKNMPNLRHLRLFSHKIENKGLEAILDGCPNLESLHLRQCSGLDLQGGLGKRCSDQIKDFILHSESCQSEHDSESSHETKGDQVDYDWDDDND